MKVNKSPQSHYFLTDKEIYPYCRKHNIVYRKLKNGITLIGVARDIKDSVTTDINFIFRSGSWFDPPAKAGLHHLTEHLINADKIKSAYARLTYKDIKKWVDHLATTDPFTVVLGDI